MPLVTIIECDGCKKRLEILENQETPGAEEVLSLTDAMGKKIFFCSKMCCQKWLEKYTCPYKDKPSQNKGRADDFLPGLN